MIIRLRWLIELSLGPPEGFGASGGEAWADRSYRHADKRRELEVKEKFLKPSRDICSVKCVGFFIKEMKF